MLPESIVGLDGERIQKYSGVCLETQIHPNAINEVMNKTPHNEIIVMPFFSIWSCHDSPTSPQQF